MRPAARLHALGELLARLAFEARATVPDPTPVVGALRVLGDANGNARVTRALSDEGGVPLDAGKTTFETIAIDDAIYARIPTRGARISLLRTLAARTSLITLRVPIVYEGGRLGRLVVDVPRAVARELWAPHADREGAAAPGDRFAGGYRHLYFDEAELIDEVSAAGLVVQERRGFTFLLARGRDEDDASVRSSARASERTTGDDTRRFLGEIAAVLAVVRTAERARLAASPREAVAAMRARGQAMPTRDLRGRAHLRSAIGWVDALFPSGPNCYRRTLVELALDRGAAGETIVFGLDVGRTGHVAFKDREPFAFDVVFEVDSA